MTDTPDFRGDQTDAPAAEPPQPDSIAQRAYERFQARGGEHGRDQDDWFDAERDVKDRQPG